MREKSRDCSRLGENLNWGWWSRVVVQGGGGVVRSKVGGGALKSVVACCPGKLTWRVGGYPVVLPAITAFFSTTGDVVCH